MPTHLRSQTNQATAGEDAREHCVDGSVWDDSPEGIREWVVWFDTERPVLTGDELKQFEANVPAMRAEQKKLVSIWQERIGRLFQ